jgi:hypothetical protein
MTFFPLSYPVIPIDAFSGHWDAQYVYRRPVVVYFEHNELVRWEEPVRWTTNSLHVPGELGRTVEVVVPLLCDSIVSGDLRP